MLKPIVIGGMHQLEPALLNYEQALRLNPNYAEANWSKSYVLLLLGRYNEGWPLYEWRRRINLFQNALRPQGNPLLPGTELKNHDKVFIYCEQGLGDTIQFCRYVKALAQKNANIFFQVPKVLRSLIQSLDPKISLVNAEDGIPEFDYQTSVMSLPWFFGTTLETIPHQSSYLSPSGQAMEQWAEAIGKKTKPRIGLVWAGAANHSNDLKRGIPLEQMVTILSPNYEWHSIQCEYREEDQKFMNDHPEIIQHQDEIKDFDDTAALVEHMDLIISRDTSVAHLAGALGKPVWILLPCVPDFRWLMDRQDSPWYPSAKLYRQVVPGEWRSVLERIKRDIEERLFT